MKTLVEMLLRRPSVALAGRLALTFPFWSSGISKIVEFEKGVAEMAFAGLEPAAVVNVATILTQLLGSLAIVTGRGVWVGCGALGVFTGLTIPLVHRFWEMDEPFQTIAMHTAIEHVGIIGGLLLAAVLSSSRSEADPIVLKHPRSSPNDGGRRTTAG